MELSSVESDISTANLVVAEKLGAWATGNWLTDKYFDPDHKFSKLSVDYTTEGFDEAKLVRIGDLAVQAA